MATNQEDTAELLTPEEAARWLGLWDQARATVARDVAAGTFTMPKGYSPTIELNDGPDGYAEVPTDEAVEAVVRNRALSALRYQVYHRQRIRRVRVGKRVRYRKADLLDYLERGGDEPLATT